MKKRRKLSGFEDLEEIDIKWTNLQKLGKMILHTGLWKLKAGKFTIHVS